MQQQQRIFAWLHVIFTCCTLLISGYIIKPNDARIGWCGFSLRSVHLSLNGAPSSNTLNVLDILDQLHLKVSFFVGGYRSRVQPSVVQEIMRRGHLVGNNGWTLQDLSTMSDVDAQWEERNTRLYLKSIMGGDRDVPWFRPAQSGGIDDSVFDEIENAGVKMVYWTMNPQSSTTLVSRSDDGTNMIKYLSSLHQSYLQTYGRQPASVILLLDDENISLESLNNTVNFYRNLTYTFVGFDECLRRQEGDYHGRPCVPECPSGQLTSTGCGAAVPYPPCTGRYTCDPGCSWKNGTAGPSSCSGTRCFEWGTQCTVRNFKDSCRNADLVCGESPSCSSQQCGGCGYGQCSTDRKSCIEVDTSQVALGASCLGTQLFDIEKWEVRVNATVRSTSQDGFVMDVSLYNYGARHLQNVIVGFEEDVWGKDQFKRTDDARDTACSTPTGLFDNSDPSKMSVLVRRSDAKLSDMQPGGRLDFQRLVFNRYSCVPQKFRMFHGFQVDFSPCLIVDDAEYGPDYKRDDSNLLLILVAVFSAVFGVCALVVIAEWCRRAKKRKELAEPQKGLPSSSSTNNTTLELASQHVDTSKSEGENNSVSNDRAQDAPQVDAILEIQDDEVNEMRSARGMLPTVPAETSPPIGGGGEGERNGVSRPKKSTKSKGKKPSKKPSKKKSLKKGKKGGKGSLKKKVAKKKKSQSGSSPIDHTHDYGTDTSSDDVDIEDDVFIVLNTDVIKS